jgi:hypothetical protein
MGIFDGLRRIFGPAQTDNGQEKNFGKLLKEAMDVCSDFGLTLETFSPEDGMGPLQSELRLPYPKVKIQKSFEFLQAIFASADTRALAIKILSPETAQYFMSAEYARSIDSGLAYLQTFVPDDQLIDQRKQVEDMVPFIDSLPEEDREKLLATGDMRAVVDAARQRLSANLNVAANSNPVS